MQTFDRSIKMNLINEDLARSHPGAGGASDRWRGPVPVPGRRVSRAAEPALSARLAVARLLYGGGSWR